MEITYTVTELHSSVHMQLGTRRKSKTNPESVCSASVAATQLWDYPGPGKFHLAWKLNCSPGGMPTCQLTVGLVPPRRAETFWHCHLEHFSNLIVEQDLRGKKTQKRKEIVMGLADSS